MSDGKRVMSVTFEEVDRETASEVVRTFCSPFNSLDTVGGVYLMELAILGETRPLELALDNASHADTWRGSFKVEGGTCTLIPHIGDRVLRVTPQAGYYKIVADYSLRPSDYAASGVVHFGQNRQAVVVYAATTLDLGTVTALLAADGKWEVTPKAGWIGGSRRYDTLDELASGEQLDPQKVRELAGE